MRPPGKIAVAGEILVEIMADAPGEGFREPLALTGPFPSGAPAIFIDQVARLGQPCAIVAAVGDDDFGRLNLERLTRDGVDVSAVGIDPDRPTGSAFVRYRSDGSRDFIFNIRHSAAGGLESSAASARLLDETAHFHVMGSSLSSPGSAAFNLSAAKAVKARGGSISFDPNLRREMLGSPGLRSTMRGILSLTDVFLPSGDELSLLTRDTGTEAAVGELLDLGIRAVVHKLGSDGVRYFDRTGTRRIPAFEVDEVDPTGAGDCFGGAFVALWVQGRPIDEVLLLASAAGALAVTRRGPMEGVADLETLLRFAKSHDHRRKD